MHAQFSCSCCCHYDGEWPDSVCVYKCVAVVVMVFVTDSTEYFCPSDSNVISRHSTPLVICVILT